MFMIICISIIVFLSTVSATFQDDGLCSLVKATNITSIKEYSQWQCNENGLTTTNPCYPLWNGVKCTNGIVVEIIINNKLPGGS